MPSVMTSHGAIRYKTIPLFPGVKRIDKEIAFENLCLLKSILGKCRKASYKYSSNRI